MPRDLKIALGIIAGGVLIGLLSLYRLHRRIQSLEESQISEEQARRAVLAPQVSTATDVKVRAKLFWAAGSDRVAPVEVELALSADPVQRAKQVLHTLVTAAPSPEQRTLPADAAVLGFYVLPDGTAVADFSDALSSEVPSGILSEELAIDSVARTLESNVTSLRRLKILIQGQEAETLAGNLDLTGYFDLNPPAQAAALPASAAAVPSAAAPH